MNQRAQQKAAKERPIDKVTHDSLSSHDPMSQKTKKAAVGQIHDAGPALTLPKVEEQGFMPRSPQITVTSPGDEYEQEADRVAANVVNKINLNEASASSGEQVVERGPHGLGIMKKSDIGRSQHRVSDSLSASISQAKGRGQNLPDAVRKPMEQAFGADFSSVRIHTDAVSHELNRSLQATAFTTGRDVFFRQNAFQPDTRNGKQMIAHELTHVVQQKNGHGASPVIQRQLTALALRGGSTPTTRWGAVVASVTAYNAAPEGTYVEVTQKLALLDMVEAALNGSRALDTGFLGFRHRNSRADKRMQGRQLQGEIPVERRRLQQLRAQESRRRGAWGVIDQPRNRGARMQQQAQHVLGMVTTVANHIQQGDLRQGQQLLDGFLTQWGQAAQRGQQFLNRRAYTYSPAHSAAQNAQRWDHMIMGNPMALNAPSYNPGQTKITVVMMNATDQQWQAIEALRTSQHVADQDAYKQAAYSVMTSMEEVMHWIQDMGGQWLSDDTGVFKQEVESGRAPGFVDDGGVSEFDEVDILAWIRDQGFPPWAIAEWETRYGSRQYFAAWKVNN